MKRLFDLSIRRKFAVVILPLIIIIVIFDYLQIKDHYLDYSDSRRLNSAIVVGVEINSVVHELQKERSISTGYLSSSESQFGGDLASQRRVTDSTIARFRQEVRTEELTDLMKLHQNDVDLVNRQLDRLVSLRKKIDDKDISSREIISQFPDINDNALNTVDILINETRDKDIAQQVHSLIYFLKSKEQASVERALGTQAFTQQHMDYGLMRDYGLFRDYTAVVAAQKAYLEDFLIISNSKSQVYYQKTVDGSQVDSFNEMRQVLFKNQQLDVDPEYWYEMATARINLMKQVEDYMSEQLLIETDKISNAAVRDFWVFLIIDIFVALLAFWLMSTIVSNLLENVGRLENYTQRVATGDMSQKVYVETRDELGDYASAFNMMVEEIKKSQALLKKERDRARYLYKNIYRVYQVVFENVHQGIFLLDRNFKISKLYSSAMEGIFDNQKIAGENFANFMRPMILPREVEALEMFMKHLFNDDMDEEVVNQLNPIEQVKIYTEKEGVVATKYINVSFTRVYRKDQIINIMVTISDETEAILLQQHLEEAEVKKKQETEQVLSILKIDPSVLRGFIFNSKKALRDIYDRYENEKSGKLSDLLDYTFEVVHNLKGNAIVIGLEFMGDKFHQIEEAIQDMKNRESLNAKDFLTVLYETDAADQVLTDMSDMLKKMANIYQKFPAEGKMVSNIMVIDSLEKGVETISKEAGKRVNLDFINESNLVIPDVYLNSFKDVMIQLVKNSIVHSIESPEERKKLGKMPSGRLTIVLEQAEHGGIQVNYRDDGRGLDLGKIKKKAIERDLITKFESDQMPDDEAMYLIFEKGFSTSDSVDNLSGRGQGMNLVRTLLEGHEASYQLHNNEGVFFGLSMKFPEDNTATEEENPTES